MICFLPASQIGSNGNGIGFSCNVIDLIIVKLVACSKIGFTRHGIPPSTVKKIACENLLLETLNCHFYNGITLIVTRVSGDK